VRIKFENVIVSIRILSGAMAFFIVVTIGAIRNANPPALLAMAWLVAIIFYLFGSVIGSILEQINNEIQLKPLTEKELRGETDMIEPPGEKGRKSRNKPVAPRKPNDISRMVDVKQRAEMPEVR
jgi:hypothetical protein